MNCNIHSLKRITVYRELTYLLSFCAYVNNSVYISNSMAIFYATILSDSVSESSYTEKLDQTICFRWSPLFLFPHPIFSISLFVNFRIFDAVFDRPWKFENDIKWAKVAIFVTRQGVVNSKISYTVRHLDHAAIVST